MPYRNPIVGGFHPDPSVCRAGDDYYLVNSSFEYFPGVPIHHSKDLVHWRHIGYCLTRASQLPLAKCEFSCGIYAPSIRYHNGRFYMITTNVTGGGHFYVHTDDPAGEWSDPIWIRGHSGIDPSLLFDDDGTVYFSWAGKRMLQAPINIDTGELLEEPRIIWEGIGAQCSEGPHIYHINGQYYCLLAEGGTEYGHLISVARGPTPYGPWEPCPQNPILSHRSLPGLIHSTGHGDLVEAHDGSWWMVFLGTRPVYYPAAHHLGRETFLAPVTWRDGWPVVNEGKRVTPVMDVPTLPLHPWPAAPTRDEFEGAALSLPWNHLRNPYPDDYSLTERPGFLRLKGSAITLNDQDSPAFVGRRQQHFHCAAEAMLEFEPQRDGDEAGLTTLMNNRHHYEIAVVRERGERRVIVRRRLGNLQVVTASRPLEPGPYRLQLRADQRSYTFSIAAGAGGDLVPIDTADIRYLSTEMAGGFTGMYIGLYATGNGARASAPADVDWFDYRQLHDDPVDRIR